MKNINSNDTEEIKNADTSNSNDAADNETAAKRKNPITKKGKIIAVLWSFVFVIICFIVYLVSVEFSYILPWNARIVRRSIEQTADSQAKAFYLADSVVLGTVKSIVPNKYQYDKLTGDVIVYSLVMVDVKEVLKSDQKLPGTLKLAILGGTYKNVTYIYYPTNVGFRIDDELIFLLNVSGNGISLAGEPFSRLIRKGEKYSNLNFESYTMEKIKEVINNSQQPVQPGMTAAPQ